MKKNVLGILIFSAFMAAADDSIAREGAQHADGDQTPIGMVLIKGGTLEMGDAFGDGSRLERPVHPIAVDNYYLGVMEVTVAEWQDFVDDRGGSMPATPAWGWHASFPVVNITWFDAIEYCNWRSRREGLQPVYSIEAKPIRPDLSANGYRLPTEAEWEFAARGRGRLERWPGTNDKTDVGDFAWHSGNAGNQIHPVGQKRPNALGLFDMSGNASEWCWDNFDYYQVDGFSQPHFRDMQQYRVLRGGSIYSNVKDMRVTYREGRQPFTREFFWGFRLARSAK